ncbi:MAG TPA: DUF4364 family protein [Tepidimicrobium sp.]|nr:DUF4364 family protein [Tepidimicrobium sp.]
MFIENTEELAQNKLILLYIIDQSSIPLTNDEITEFVMENNYMNYFLIQQYLIELIESKFIKYIDEKEDRRYILSNKGNTTLFYFKDRINNRIKREISKKFSKLKKEIKKTTQIIGNFQKKNEKEYIVNLKLIKNQSAILNLSLTVPTADQARIICNKWKSDPECIYETIFNALINDTTSTES